MEIQYKYIFNDRGDEGHGCFVMGEDRWGLSKAANHDMCIMDCLVSSTATDEEGLDIQKFAKINILWTNRVYMLSMTTNKKCILFDCGNLCGYGEIDDKVPEYIPFVCGIAKVLLARDLFS